MKVLSKSKVEKRRLRFDSPSSLRSYTAIKVSILKKKRLRLSFFDCFVQTFSIVASLPVRQRRGRRVTLTRLWITAALKEMDKQI